MKNILIEALKANGVDLFKKFTFEEMLKTKKCLAK